jgi:hypothetical protein
VPVHGLRFTPEQLEVIEVPRLGAEQMDDSVAEVDEHPARAGVPLRAQQRPVEVLDGVGHLVSYGLDLALVAAGSDDEVVGEGGNGPDVEDEDVLGLAFVGEPCAQARKLCCLVPHGRFSSPVRGPSGPG